MVKRFAPLIVCALMAAASFAYARHRYIEKHSVTLTNPFRSNESTRVTSPLVDRGYLGKCVQDQWVFALLIPAGLLGTGVALSAKR